MPQKRYHIIIDISDAPPGPLTDEAGLREFLKALPGRIGMHVLKGPEIAVGIPENPGLSGFVIIDYSHISVHTFTASGDAMVDIFSCKPFEQEDAVDFALKHFQVPREKARIKVVFWE